MAMKDIALGGAIGAYQLRPTGASVGALVGNAPTPSTPFPNDDLAGLKGPGQSTAGIEAREWSTSALMMPSTDSLKEIHSVS